MNCSDGMSSIRTACVLIPMCRKYIWIPNLAAQLYVLHVRKLVDYPGLQVQPAKSQIAFINTAIYQLTYQDIAVIAPPTTTRYLSYQVGTGKLRDINWALRIKSAQRRLFTATRVATTLEHRVLISTRSYYRVFCSRHRSSIPPTGRSSNSIISTNSSFGKLPTGSNPEGTKSLQA